MINKYHVRRFIWLGLMTGGVALAGSPSSYLGFTFNMDKSATEKLLKSRQSVYESDYGYLGYVKDLPSIKINADPLLNKFGNIKEGWLNFTPPPHRLYKIYVSFADSGKAYILLRDVLNQKYTQNKTRQDGFIVTHYYQDNDVEITLTRNSFGFGERQTTSLQYVYLPSLGAVNVRKAKIDQHIKQEKLKSAGGDL